MVQGVWSENLEQQIDATTQFRKLLSIGKLSHFSSDQWFAAPVTRCSKLIDVACISAERNPPIEEVISQGVIPRFVQFLQRQDAPQLQVRDFLVAHRIASAQPLFRFGTASVV